MTATEYPQGWIAVDISEDNERWAKAKRAERDQQYGNIYQEAATDERWVGTWENSSLTSGSGITK